MHWQPPQKALDKVKDVVLDPTVSSYGPDEGIPELRQALQKKLREENKLTKSAVMVTAGANQVVYMLFGAKRLFLLLLLVSYTLCFFFLGY